MRPFDAVRDHWRGGQGVVILEYGDYECLLFHRQNALDEDDLFAYARQVGLDEARLRDDLGRDELWQRVREDATSALAAGAQGTPTLFVDGRLHRGGYDRDTLWAAAKAAEARD